jgi:hypothetical protein
MDFRAFNFFALFDFLTRSPIGTFITSASSSIAAYRLDVAIGGRRSNSGTEELLSLSHDSRRLVPSLGDESSALGTELKHPRERK